MPGTEPFGTGHLTPFFLMPSSTVALHYDVTLNIGEMPILIRTDSADFASMLRDRYGEFVSADVRHPAMELEIRLVPEPGLGGDPEAEVTVSREGGRWIMARGDFRAEWDTVAQRGWVRQTVNPYSIDGVLRILHSLILARQGGLLVHAASAVRNGRAFVFAGVSETGKTTISRLAPADVMLLTDEISYLRGVGRQESEIRSPKAENQVPSPDSPAPSPQHPAPAFLAFGTPFAGELARIGQKMQAPLDTLFLLQQGPENRIEAVSDGQAVRELMRHILFFAHDPELVELVFQTVCDLVKRVPVKRLVFKKDASVWNLIG